MVDRLGDLRKNENFRLQGECSMEREVKPINERLDRLRKLGFELEALQQDYLLDADKDTQKKIDRSVEAIGTLGAEAKQHITALGERTTEQEERGRISGTEVRIRRNQFLCLSNRLIEVTRGTWDAQNEHTTKVKSKVARQIKIKYTQQDGTTMSDADANLMAAQLVESNKEDQVFAQAREELIRVMRTHDELIQIERSMTHLHQMFVDLQMLVDEQGEGIDVVQNNINSAHDYVSSGEKHLRAGRKAGAGCCIIS